MLNVKMKNAGKYKITQTIVIGRFETTKRTRNKHKCKSLRKRITYKPFRSIHANVSMVIGNFTQCLITYEIKLDTKIERKNILYVET